MQLTSDDIRDGAMMDAVFTCDGEDISPHLAWSGAPVAAKSFSLRCFDPDAPGKGWLHWLAVGIPASAREIPRGGPLPTEAVELPNDFGRTPYGGPCPPSGAHRYYFTLYALDVADLPGVMPGNFEAAVKPHTLAAAVLMGRYQRRR